MSTYHSVVHEVHARQFEFLVASVEAVNGIVAVGGVSHEGEAGQLSTQVLRWSAPRT